MTSRQLLKQEFDEAEDKFAWLNEVREFLHELSPNSSQPVDRVWWVPVSKVQANDYNPNSVAHNEMRLLHTSISHDGYTQPVVTIYDPELQKYIIVDGFHRYSTVRNNKDIQAMTNGMVPIVVLDKQINDRMASTVRHNRARGKHSVTGMANMVFSMLDNGWEDGDICNELGLSLDELLRLKHVSGFSKLFADVTYRKAWETKKMVNYRKQYQNGELNGYTAEEAGSGDASDSVGEAVLAQPEE